MCQARYPRPVIALRLVVLALGVALGVFYPFIPVILASRGFGPAEIGLIASVGAFGFTLAVPAWGHIADVRLGRAARSSCVRSAAARPSAPCSARGRRSRSRCCSWPSGSSRSSWQPLADALTVNLVDRRRYGRVRLLTSLSFAISSIVAGFIYDTAGFDAAYVLGAVAAVTIALAAGGVPDVGRADLDHPHRGPIPRPDRAPGSDRLGSPSGSPRAWARSLWR